MAAGKGTGRKNGTRKTREGRNEGKPPGAQQKKASREKAAKVPVAKALSGKNIGRNIKFCEAAIELLKKQEVRESLLKGELPPELKHMSFELAMIETMADAVPDESWLRAGIWLPSKEFLNAPNKAMRMVKLVLYYGYWKHGPYFTPVHAAAHMLMNYVPEIVRPKLGVKAGSLVRKRFTEKGKLIVTQGDIDRLIGELNRELVRNRKLAAKKK